MESAKIFSEVNSQAASYHSRKWTLSTRIFSHILHVAWYSLNYLHVFSFSKTPSESLGLWSLLSSSHLTSLALKWVYSPYSNHEACATLPSGAECSSTSFIVCFGDCINVFHTFMHCQICSSFALSKTFMCNSNGIQLVHDWNYCPLSMRNFPVEKV